MDTGLFNAAFKENFIRTRKISQDAQDQGESNVLEESFPPKLPSFTDLKYHKIRDNLGNRHLVKEEEVRDEDHLNFQQRSRELF